MPAPDPVLKRLLTFPARHWGLLSVLVLALLTVLSLMPMSGQLPVGGNDKVMHAFGWGVAIIPASLALGQRVVSVALLFLLWSIVIEFLQPFSGRHFEVADMVANAIGIALGMSLSMGLRKLLSRKWKS